MFDRERFRREISKHVELTEDIVRALVQACGGECGELREYSYTKCGLGGRVVRDISSCVEVWNEPGDKWVIHPEHIYLAHRQVIEEPGC